MMQRPPSFFFNDTATTEIYTLSLLDALPISPTAVAPTRGDQCVVLLSSRRLRSSARSEEHTSELQSHLNLVCRLLLEKKKTTTSSAKSNARSACRVCTPSSTRVHSDRGCTTG